MAMRTKGRRTLFVLSLLAILMLHGHPVWAQRGAGIQGGISVDPDQLYFGGHLRLGKVVEKLWFRPSLDVGLGSDLTSIGINGEFLYPVLLQNPKWDIYFGAGPAINIFTFHRDFPGRNDNDVGAGFNLLIGLGHRDGFFGEIKVGALDSPEFKLGFGYTFPSTE